MLSGSCALDSVSIFPLATAEAAVGGEVVVDAGGIVGILGFLLLFFFLFGGSSSFSFLFFFFSFVESVLAKRRSNFGDVDFGSMK